jgi:hypothetical protein
MRLPPALDRLWTYTVWAAYLFLMPILTILWFQRMPALGFIFAACIVWFLGSHALGELRRETRRDPPGDTRDRPRVP